MHNAGMQLIVPEPHPGAVLLALSQAQQSPAACAVLAESAMAALLAQSAVPVRSLRWDGWPEQANSARLTEWAAHRRWRNALAEWSPEAWERVLYCPAVPDPVVSDARHAQSDLAPSGENTSPQQEKPESGRTYRLAAWFAAHFGVGLACASTASCVTSSAAEPAVRLYAQADALARVAGLFRQTPPGRAGAFRFIWVVPHAMAAEVAERHAAAFGAVCRALGTCAVHLHIVRLTPDHLDGRLLARDARLMAWRTCLRGLAAADQGEVRDLGSLRVMAGAAEWVGLLAHADVVLSCQPWVLVAAQGLGKACMRVNWPDVWLAHHIGRPASPGVSVPLQSSFFSEVCERFPFIMKR